MIGDKVFKFPDGKGGFILKIRGDDDQWHVCDAEGNYIEEEKEPDVKSAPSQKPKVRTSGTKSLGKKTSIYLPEDLFKQLRHYGIDNEMSMTEIINEAVSAFLSKKKKDTQKSSKE